MALRQKHISERKDRYCGIGGNRAQCACGDESRGVLDRQNDIGRAGGRGQCRNQRAKKSAGVLDCN